jgi:hypothetical protein
LPFDFTDGTPWPRQKPPGLVIVIQSEKRRLAADAMGAGRCGYNRFASDCKENDQSFPVVILERVNRAKAPRGRDLCNVIDAFRAVALRKDPRRGGIINQAGWNGHKPDGYADQLNLGGKETFPESAAGEASATQEGARSMNLCSAEIIIYRAGLAGTGSGPTPRCPLRPKPACAPGRTNK